MHFEVPKEARVGWPVNALKFEESLWDTLSLKGPALEEASKE